MTSTAPPEPAVTEELEETVAMLRRRLDELDMQASDTATRTSRLERDLETIAPEGTLAAGTISDEDVWTEALKGHKVSLGGKDGKLVSVNGAPLLRLGGFGKAGELMRLSEDERWAKLREDLSLDSYQESELKQIRSDMQAEMKDMVKVDPDTGKMTASFDFKKYKEARDRADERVKNLLGKDQYDKFQSGGYAAALGMGGHSVAVSYSTSTITPKDK
jgi:hypothetical protein